MAERYPCLDSDLRTELTGPVGRAAAARFFGRPPGRDEVVGARLRDPLAIQINGGPQGWVRTVRMRGARPA